MTPDEKGWELEIAVEAIEAVILESSPSLLGQPFKIQRRKRINVGDVHHEIDIFVQVGAAKGYESTFIFECKNWEAPVGKNEIIVFSENLVDQQVLRFLDEYAAAVARMGITSCRWTEAVGWLYNSLILQPHNHRKVSPLPKTDK